MAKGPLDDLLPSLTADDLTLMDDDLARLTELTGRSEIVAVTGGPVMALWGLVMPLTSLAYILRYIDILPPRLPIILLQVVLGYGGTFWIWWTRGRNRRFNPWQAKALLTIWVFACGGLTLFNIGTMVTHQVNMMLNSAMNCMMFGTATAVLGSIGRRGWLLLPASGWMAAGMAMFFLPGVIERQSVLAAAAILCMLIPGIILSFDRKRA